MDNSAFRRLKTSDGEKDTGQRRWFANQTSGKTLEAARSDITHREKPPRDEDAAWQSAIAVNSRPGQQSLRQYRTPGEPQLFPLRQ